MSQHRPKTVAPPRFRPAWAVLVLFAVAAHPARALQPTDPVKISEVHYDPVENPESPFEFIELFNAGAQVAFLDGAVISDQGNNGTNETTFQFPGTPLTGTTIPIQPGEYVLIVVSATGSPYAGIDWECYAGATDSDDPSVPNLVKTSGLGSDLGLANTGDGITLSTGVTNGNVIPCNEVVDGVSWEDGGGAGEINAVSRLVCSDPAPHPGVENSTRSLQRFAPAADTNRSADDFGVAVRTPGSGAPCAADPDCVENLRYAPCVPAANQAVDVTVTVGPSAWTAVRVFYRLEGVAVFDSLPMGTGDGTVYTAALPGRALQAHVQYWVKAIDSAGNVVTEPAGAPGVVQDYRVGAQSIATIQGSILPDTCGTSTFTGQAVNIRAAVTHVAAEFALDSFYVQTGTGPNSGIRIVDPLVPIIPTLGDSVEVAGIVREVDCETQLVVFPECNQVLAIQRKVRPRIVASLGVAAVEENEGVLVEAPGPITVVTGFDVPPPDGEFRIASGRDSAWVGSRTFSVDAVGYTLQPAPGQLLDRITGIIGPRTRNGADAVRRLRIEPRRDNDVDRDYTDVGGPDDSLTVVPAFRLHPNVPNPFNPTTTITYELAAAGPATVEIFDAHGLLVRRLAQGPVAAGTHRVSWDGRDGYGRETASGLYVVRLKAGGETASRKMLLLR